MANVEHGRVIMVMRDQMLRLQSALGPLQGRAVTGVLTFQLKPDERPGSKATLLTLSYVVNGASASALDKSAAPGRQRSSTSSSNGWCATWKPGKPTP